jgi:hypothetical protein
VVSGFGGSAVLREIHARLYVNPALGDVPVGKISAQMLEERYAKLRRCRVRCDGRPFIEHRVDGPHECRVVKHRQPPGRRPAAGYSPHDCDAMKCKVIECSRTFVGRSRRQPFDRFTTPSAARSRRRSAGSGSSRIPPQSGGSPVNPTPTRTHPAQTKLRAHHCSCLGVRRGLGRFRRHEDAYRDQRRSVGGRPRPRVHRQEHPARQSSCAHGLHARSPRYYRRVSHPARSCR